MSLTVPSIDQLLHAIPLLENGRSIYFDGKGSWCEEGVLKRLWKKVRCTENQPIVSFFKLASANLDELEHKAVRFYTDAEKLNAYKTRFQPYFDLAHRLENYIQRIERVSSKVQEAYISFQIRFLSMQYRIGSLNGGLDKAQTADQELLNALKEKALDWKRSKGFYDKTLSQWELNELETMARYSQITQLILTSNSQLDFIFSRMIKDFIPVDVCLECPGALSQLKAAILTSYIGSSRHPERGEEPLVLTAKKVEGGWKKTLNLLFFHGNYDKLYPEKIQQVNILNPNKAVTFEKGNYTLRLKEIWKECGLKNEREVRFNWTAQGLVNYDPREKGYWDAQKQQYVEEGPAELPFYQKAPAFNIVSAADIEKKFGVNVKEKDFFFRIMARRKNLNMGGSHGFFQLFYKMEGTDKYKVINYGKFADQFQITWWDALRMICGTLKRCFSLIDQNGSLVDRELAGTALIIPTQEQAKEFLNRFEKDLQSEGVFQFSGDNCSHYVQESVHAVMGPETNYFSMSVFDNRTGLAVLDKLLRFLKHRHRIIQFIGLTLIHLTLGSWRSMTIQENGRAVRKSVFQFYWSGRTEVSTPAFLHEQIKSGQVAGSLAFGNIEAKI
jgi:hypothetical protein